MHHEQAIYEIKNLQLDPQHLLLNETLFHNANGYIGIRSVFEEGYPEGYPSIRGQYINGFYDYSTVNQAESLCGLVREKQTMLNVADTQSIRLTFDDEAFNMFYGTVLFSRRWVDMHKGITGRQIHWRSPKGKELKLTITRMASFHQLPLFTIDYEIEPLNFSSELFFESDHNGNAFNFADPNDPRNADENAHYLYPVSCEILDKASYITAVTSRSHLNLCSCVKNVLQQEGTQQFFVENYHAVSKIKTHVVQGQKTRLVKYAVFCDSARYDNCREQAYIEIEKALSAPLASLYQAQEDYLTHYWSNCGIKIEGDEATNTSIKYNLYQLIQSVGKDRHSNIGPKGLSGEGYEGHYFWDTEMFIQPFFTVTNPEISKGLIAYRYETLNCAREHARILGHQTGALYPWRTIMGKECSGYFPAGSAQYHINGDIAYSIIAYYLATKDLNFIAEKGAEIVFETARLWMDAGHFDGNRFFIHSVTGPDEYTCLVNNNYYTNALAQYHLGWTVTFYNLLKSKRLLQPLAERIALKEKEIDDFGKAAKCMYLPYDSELRINPQDDSFLKKKKWDLRTIPKDHFPLLLHYHPLHLYRHQICKQADTVMAHFILEDTASQDTIRRSYQYYEKITTHDSSLSNCIFSIVAAKLGMEKKAYDYFTQSAQLDMLDKHHNTKDGIHAANMGGNYMAIVYGFAGLRLKASGLYFAPILPKKWTAYHFKIAYEDSHILVTVNQAECIFSLESGSAKQIFIYDSPHWLRDKLRVKRLKKQTPVPKRT